jgi:hypothetical protein
MFTPSRRQAKDGQNNPGLGIHGWENRDTNEHVNIFANI